MLYNYAWNDVLVCHKAKTTCQNKHLTPKCMELFIVQNLKCARGDVYNLKGS